MIKKKNIVPNFVDGSLPRCDKGDKEYYCATMLILFKLGGLEIFLKIKTILGIKLLIYMNSMINKNNI